MILLTCGDVVGPELAARLSERGRDASYEYPGFVRVSLGGGGFWDIGTANGNWGGTLGHEDYDGQISDAFELADTADSDDVETLADLIEAELAARSPK